MTHLGAHPALHDSLEQHGTDASDTIGGRLTRARAAEGLTTSQLARRVGIKTQTLHNWETDRTAPRSNRLAMLAGVLNVSPTWILVGLGEAPPEDEEAAMTDDRQGLLRLRQSIQTKIEELRQIIDEVDGMLEKHSGS